MDGLWVLYDSRCELCLRIRHWISVQEAWFPVRAVAAGSDEARRMFPGFETDDLFVVASDGRYWRGGHAWLMVLFAMKRYRWLAMRLASPALRPLARQAFAMVSENRRRISRFWELSPDEEIGRALRGQRVPGCHFGEADTPSR